MKKKKKKVHDGTFCGQSTEYFKYERVLSSFFFFTRKSIMAEYPRMVSTIKEQWRVFFGFVFIHIFFICFHTSFCFILLMHIVFSCSPPFFSFKNGAGFHVYFGCYVLQNEITQKKDKKLSIIYLLLQSCSIYTYNFGPSSFSCFSRKDEKQPLQPIIVDIA